jgi:hypothetical protein
MDFQQWLRVLINEFADPAGLRSVTPGVANPERNGEKLVLTNNTLWGKNAFPNVRLRFLMRPLHIRLQRLHEPRFDQKSSLYARHRSFGRPPTQNERASDREHTVQSVRSVFPPHPPKKILRSQRKRQAKADHQKSPQKQFFES